MKAQTAQRGFPTALLTFSVMLVVLGIGFAIGRVVVAPAYLGAAPRIEPQGVGGSELDANRAAPGRVNVPSPSGSPPPDDDSERRDLASEGREGRPPTEAEPGEGRLPGEAHPSLPEEPVRAPVVVPPGQEEPARKPSTADRPQPSEEVSAGRQAENTTKTYSIQVGVFSSLQGARQVVDDLARGGYPARISPDKRGAQTLYRVVTGRYQSEYAARKALEQLRTEGFEAFLIEQQ